MDRAAEFKGELQNSLLILGATAVGAAAAGFFSGGAAWASEAVLAAVAYVIGGILNAISTIYDIEGNNGNQGIAIEYELNMMADGSAFSAEFHVMSLSTGKIWSFGVPKAFADNVKVHSKFGSKTKVYEEYDPGSEQRELKDGSCQAKPGSQCYRSSGPR
jgi:hypothetical protein